ncbi:MAG TPA: transposase family protein, partial [Candidatus Nitrosocosmicus sp.]
KVRYKKGRKHDYDVYKRNHPIVIPKEVVNVFDLGYLGVETNFPDQLSTLPYKKKRNQFLSDDEKEYNKIHSKMRIIVEHTISRLKKYRIMSYVFRNKLRKYNKVSDIVAGLVNYRISNQQN